MRLSVRSAQSFFLALVVGLALTACGDKDASKTAAGGDSNPTAGADADSGSEGGDNLTKSNFNNRMFSAIEKAGSAHVRFETAAGGQTSTGDGEVKYGDTLSMRVKMSGADGGAPREVLLIGDTFYVNLGEKYMTMSLKTLEGMGMPNLSANLDPKIQAKAFSAATTSLEQNGEPETLDGVKATPYDITIDPTKAPDIFGTSMKKPLKFTYYVGSDDLPRKMVYRDPNGDFTATYTAWGEPVEIEAPPASEIMEGM